MSLIKYFISLLGFHLSAFLALAKFPFKVSTAASPVVAGDLIYCSAGYGVGAGLYKISKKENQFLSSEVWRKKNEMFNHWSTPIHHNGHLYGMFSFKKYGKGPLQCIELESGEVKWSKDGYGPGNVILSGNKLIALSDVGEVAVVEATPSKYKGRGKALSREKASWNVELNASMW